MQLVKNVTGALVWIVAIAASAYFFMDNVWAFTYGYRSNTFGDSLFNNQVWFVAHLVGGSLALPDFTVYYGGTVVVYYFCGLIYH